MNKKELRREMLQRMAQQPEHEVLKKSRIITDFLISTKIFKDAKDIFVYISKPEEVRTEGIIEHALGAGKRVYAPVIEGGKIVPGRIDGNFKKGEFGLLEPASKEQRAAFDLIIVPGIAFDKKCRRIGRGGGHFDRFLLHTEGKSAGLAFSFQICDEIAAEKHDITLDFVLTEETKINA